MFTTDDFQIEESDESAIIISLNLNQYIVKFIAMRSKSKEFYQKNYKLTNDYGIKVMGYDDWFKDTIEITDKDTNSLLNKLIKRINIPKTKGDRKQRRHIVQNIFTKKEWYNI